MNSRVTISDGSLTFDLILDLQQKAKASIGLVAWIPYVSDYMELYHLHKEWKHLDYAIRNRPIYQADVPPAHREICDRILSLSAQTIGWSSPNFRLDDHVGVILWYPVDILAGVEVLIALEDLYHLPGRSLEWDDWTYRPLGSLVQQIAATSPRLVDRGDIR